MELSLYGQWLDKAVEILTTNIGECRLKVTQVRVNRGLINQPCVSFYGLIEASQYEWFLGVQFNDDAATELRHAEFGVAVVGSPDDLNSFSSKATDFKEVLARTVNATLRYIRLDDSE